jgi:hypothetical protein
MVCWAWSNSTWWLRYASSHTAGTKSALQPFLYLPVHPSKMKPSPNIQRCKHTNPFSTSWRRDLYHFEVSRLVVADQGTLFWESFWRTRDDDGYTSRKRPLAGVMPSQCHLQRIHNLSTHVRAEEVRMWSVTVFGYCKALLPRCWGKHQSLMSAFYHQWWADSASPTTHKREDT